MTIYVTFQISGKIVWIYLPKINDKYLKKHVYTPSFGNYEFIEVYRRQSLLVEYV